MMPSASNLACNRDKSDTLTPALSRKRERVSECKDDRTPTA